MATFPATPEASYGVQKNSAPKKRVVKFADGYEHRIYLGLAAKQNPKEYVLSWNNITEAECDTFEDFLNARSDDNASFDYTPPKETTSYKFVCDSWSKAINKPNRATLKATFREVFEPTV